MNCLFLGMAVVIGVLVVVLMNVTWERFKVPKRSCMENPRCSLHSYSILDNGWMCKDSEGACHLDRFCVAMRGCKGGSNLGCFDKKGACVSPI